MSPDTPPTAAASPVGRATGAPTALHLHGRTTVGDLCLEFPEDEPLVVAPGELVALVGPNGAGKSTLLRLVAGLVGLDAGSLTLGGRVADDGTVRGFVPPSARRVGWVPQNRLLFDHLTVAANVGFSPRATPDRVELLLNALDLAHLADRRPGECSGGQAQRVAVARALAAEPDVLLLDEPSTALDAGSRQRIHALLADRDGARQATRRPAILLVTHDPAEAAGLADRVVELASGRTVHADRS
jgi:molybdate transport system ATP-binding protein